MIRRIRFVLLMVFPSFRSQPEPVLQNRLREAHFLPMSTNPPWVESALHRWNTATWVRGAIRKGRFAVRCNPDGLFARGPPRARAADGPGIRKRRVSGHSTRRGGRQSRPPSPPTVRESGSDASAATAREAAVGNLDLPRRRRSENPEVTRQRPQHAKRRFRILGPSVARALSRSGRTKKGRRSRSRPIGRPVMEWNQNERGGFSSAF
ncbi:MAG: hypothetical protein QG573_1395 [Acidobacteriota bacterium]|nr:hypothetical protein [Acidobacteriota bacterium]